MDAERWARVTSLFEGARQLPAAERDAWLRRACVDDEVVAEVVAMLTAYESDPGFLEAPVAAGLAAELVQGRVRQSLQGRRLGAYRLVREIGRGGMGVVYEAERDDDEFDRRVAIKLMAAGWSAPELAERFRFERRVLAGLDHPNIARLLDAGATDEGVPYFVMELVEGQPIDEWCRERASTVRRRVELVHAVARAVSYAHQHLVVHRDLKPANILVTASGEPKLLDFGIATLVSEAEGLSTGLTTTGQHGFTAEYASPEQIRGERVTTATDVYSLGVVLYLLLVHLPPYDLRGLSPHEAMRVACEVEPPPPSRVAPAGKRDVLRGDLDNIVLKALRKNPGERYVSVADLADDLRAWLEGRPVSATPPTPAYRMRKYVARHRVAVGAGAAVAVALLAGGAATAWQAHVARLERDKAERRFAQVREFSRSLLFDVHDALRPLPGATEPRRLLLDRAVQFLDGLAADAGDDAALKLELVEGYRRLGRVQGSPVSDSVGDLAGARRSLEAAARLADEALALEPRSGPAVNAVAGAYDDLGTVLNQAGDKNRAAQAYQRHQQAVERLEREHASEPGMAAAIASSYLNLGYARGQVGDNAGARTLYQKAIRQYETLPAADRTHDDVARGHARALQRLGAILISEGELDEAERCYRSALALDEAVVARNPGNAPYAFDLTFSLTDLGLIAKKRSDLVTAEAMYRRALDIRQRALEADPRNTRALAGVASAHNYVAGVYAAARRPADVAAHQRASLQVLGQVEAIEGATPTVRSRRSWSQLYLARALLDLAEATSGHTRAVQAVEAGKLLGSSESGARGLERGPLADPGFAKLLSEQRARVERLTR